LPGWGCSCDGRHFGMRALGATVGMGRLVNWRDCLVTRLWSIVCFRLQRSFLMARYGRKSPIGRQHYMVKLNGVSSQN
jgi:hypothetical protein